MKMPNLMKMRTNSAEGLHPDGIRPCEGIPACEGTKNHSLTGSITGISAIGAQCERMRESGAIFLNGGSVFQTGGRDRIATRGRTNLPPATASATRISNIHEAWGRMAEFRRNFSQASQPDGKAAPDGTNNHSVLPSDLIFPAIHAGADRMRNEPQFATGISANLSVSSILSRSRGSRGHFGRGGLTRI